MTDSQLNAIKQGLTLVFGMLTVLAPTLATAQQYSELTTAIITAIPALISAGSVIWSVYAHWGMKKVPANATAVILPTGPAPAGSTIDLTPMTGLAKVVG